MKLLFVANKLWDVYIFRGGVIKALVEDGHEITIVAPDDKRIDVGKILGVKVIDLEVDKRGINPIKDFQMMMKLSKIYKSENPDLVFHYTIKLNIFGTLASRIAKKKSIAVLTGLGYSFVNEGIISKIAKLLYKISLKFSKEVWVLNEDDKKILIEKNITNNEKIYVLPGEGINMEKYKPRKKIREDNKKIFLMIARAFYDKGFGEYAEAAKILKEKYKELVEFQFLGALGEENRAGITKEEMDRLVEVKTINYLGITNDVGGVIKEADCVVLPSYREGISMVLLEAASMEKFIIASNVTGCKEIVDNNKNGYLVEPKSIESLAEAMEKFMKLDQNQIEQMGKSGREKVKNEFDENIIINIYKEKVKKYGA